jgi:UDP-3-O-[3-hydroxymyristoyl] glucosamine N-acyltransferase
LEKKSYTAEQIAKLISGKVIGDGTVILTGFAQANSAGVGDLTFAENEKFFQLAERGAASAILVDCVYWPTHKTLIQVPNARVAFAKVLPLFFPEKEHPSGVHPTAIVCAGAQISQSAYIGPWCYIGENVIIDDKVVLHGLNYVGDGTKIGKETQIFPNVTIYAGSIIGCRVRIHSGAVIGSDGFGYVFDNGQYYKVPQIGNVVIEDEVEIGANTTIDRGALDSTVIKQGTKIDNLVMIAHNVVVGKHCIIVSQCGIAGSTTLGDYATLAGQVGIAGHLKIGNKVVIGAKSGVMDDIPDGEKWLGIPALPDQQTKRQIIANRHLPDLIKRIKDLERKIVELESTVQQLRDKKDT